MIENAFQMKPLGVCAMWRGDRSAPTLALSIARAALRELPGSWDIAVGLIPGYRPYWRAGTTFRYPSLNPSGEHLRRIADAL